MSRENEKTLEVYEKFGNAYLKNADSRRKSKMKEFKAKKKRAILEGFNSLGEGSYILEIGAANGAASLIAEELGFRAFPSDVSPQFLTEIEKTGLPYFKFDVLKDDLDGRKFDGVMAFRVFVHFTPEDLSKGLKRIYKMLRPGGRLIGDVLNSEDKGGKTGEWCDYGNGYEIGVDRYFHYYDWPQVEGIIEKTGFVLEKMSLAGGDNGKRRFEFVLSKPSGLNPELVKYISEEILPQYQKLRGHTVSHINQVIGRSLAIAEDMPDINRDMVYVIASYHDLGRLIDNETHNIESGKMMAKDKKLRELFSEEEIQTMIEAVEDHRASIKGEPRSIYGKIVGSADRYMDVNEMLKRSYDYTKVLHPEMTDDEVIDEARIHLREKFTPDGYGAKKDYFPSVESRKCYEEIEKVTREPLAYRKMMKELNKKRKTDIL